MRTKAALLLVCLACPAHAQTFDFETPSDDRWHYPFNFTAGTRTTASTFSAAPLNGFNDRDGQLVVRWDTSGLITPGQGAPAYQIESITVTLTNDAGAAWAPDLTPDEWFTVDLNGDMSINADGFPRGDPSDTDGESSDGDPGRPIELYGAGFGATYTASTWNEFSPYVGSQNGPNTARDPFPFVYQDGTGDMLHVEDHVKGLHNDTLPTPVFEFTPEPWAVGDPQGYTPGAQATPFDVEFEIDLSLSAGLVRQYFQGALDAGEVTVIVTSFHDTEQLGDPTQVGSFFTKEAVGAFVGAKAPKLTIVLSAACSAADVTTAGAGAGDPGFGTPDGQITSADLNYFVNGWIAQDASVADVTTTGAGSGDPGFGVPDGQVTSGDLNYFVNLWIAGCP